jgi:chaperone BCS1
MMASLSSAGFQLPPLFQNANSSHASVDNKTAAEFPSGVFDSFLHSAGSVSPLMQILHFVYRLLGAQFGIDPSIVLTAVGFFWGLSKIGSQVYHYLESVIDSYLMCSMHISEDDNIYYHIMKFMAQHPSTKNNKYLMAQTVYRSAWDDEDYDEEEENKALFWTNGGDSEGTGNRYLNFSNQAARLVSISYTTTFFTYNITTSLTTSAHQSPRFVPALGRTNFWHNGTYYKFFRFKEAFANSSGWGPMKDVETIKISCYGRSIGKSGTTQSNHANYLHAMQCNEPPAEIIS